MAPVHSRHASSIQGKHLSIVALGCSNLNPRTLSKHYVRFNYGGAIRETRPGGGGESSPGFNDKFTITLIEGIREIEVTLFWRKRLVGSDDCIGRGKIQLEKVLTKGIDHNVCSLLSDKGRNAGDVAVLLEYGNPEGDHGGHMEDESGGGHQYLPFHPSSPSPSPPPQHYHPHYVNPEPSWLDCHRRYQWFPFMGGASEGPSANNFPHYHQFQPHPPTPEQGYPQQPPHPQQMHSHNHPGQPYGQHFNNSTGNYPWY